MPVLTRIGYWRSESQKQWPDPADFVDEAWDEEERHMVASYLKSATVPWAAAGYSPCRLCGKPNGSAELTDGVFLWPEGLSHYVSDHAVRLPTRVVSHIMARWSDLLDQPQVDDSWWESVRPGD